MGGWWSPSLIVSETLNFNVNGFDPMRVIDGMFVSGGITRCSNRKYERIKCWRSIMIRNIFRNVIKNGRIKLEKVYV